MTIVHSFILLILPFSCSGQYTSCSYQTYGTSGTIYSPNYPRNYNNNANCTYTVSAYSLSSIQLTIQNFALENCMTCNCDWIELSCASHSIAVPQRYCGTASFVPTVVFAPCTRALIRFRTDSSITYSGFAIYYNVTQIQCANNCTLVSNSYGYSCECSWNRTSNATLSTSAPYPTCPSGCYTSSVRYNPFCYCQLYGQALTTEMTCPFGCYAYYDFYGDRRCSCATTEASITCSPGCYRTADYHGHQYCRCYDLTTSSDTCPYGCYTASDFWGRPYCNCPSTTVRSIWCSPGCTSDYDYYGRPTCRCYTTTSPPCFSPCYLRTNYTYQQDFTYCYCPPGTTEPPPRGCNQRFTDAYGIITSPNYPMQYPKGVDCYMYISVPSATYIQLRVLDINLYYSYYSSTCYYEYIQITGCNNSVVTFCDENTVLTSGLSFLCTNRSTLTIRFHSSSYYYDSFRGFKLTYSSIVSSSCSESGVYLFPNSSGIISSPNYPASFPAYSECVNYLYTDYENIKIRITFNILRLEPGYQCSRVFLKIRCHDGEQYSQTLCGSSIPNDMTFDCKNLQIWFKSSGTPSYSTRYFQLQYFVLTQTPNNYNLEDHYHDRSLQLSLGLGVGLGGTLIIVLLLIVIIVTVRFRRQSARLQQRHLNDLTALSRNLGSLVGRGEPEGTLISLDNPFSSEPQLHQPPEAAGGNLMDLMCLEENTSDETLLIA